MQDLLLADHAAPPIWCGAPERLTDLGRVFADTYAAFRSPLMLVPIGMQARLGGARRALGSALQSARVIMANEIARCRSQVQPEPSMTRHRCAGAEQAAAAAADRSLRSATRSWRCLSPDTTRRPTP